MYSFNLVTEKWIPCILPDGTREDKSIREALIDAPEIQEIFDESPLVTGALHRLLLAILHRSFKHGYGPIDNKEWNEIWIQGHFHQELFERYLELHRDRFDLFDDNYPFYQCVSLASEDASPKSEPISVGNLLHDSAIYLNKATLFDHGIEATLQFLTPAEASRFLVAFQSYAIGGFSSLSKPRVKGEGSAKGAPLVKGALCFVQGNNLFETLMLNMVIFSPEGDEPLPSENDDKPAWELDVETRPEESIVKGYFHLLTWQSRRICFIPEYDRSGNVVIGNVLIRKGNQLPDNNTLSGKDPMLAFYKRLKPGEGQDPWPPVTFHKDREMWRDSLSLFQSIEEKNARPKILDWVNDRIENGYLQPSAVYHTSLLGLVSVQATIALWHHERLPLPLKYLQDETLVSNLKEALEIAEEAGRLLGPGFVNIEFLDKRGNQKSASVPSPLRTLASEILPKDRNGKAAPDVVRKTIDSLSPARPYWAALGIVFNRLVIDLAQDESEGRRTSLGRWASEIRNAARGAFEETARSLDRTGRMLKAVSLAGNEFDTRLFNILKPYLNNTKKGGEK